MRLSSRRAPSTRRASAGARYLLPVTLCAIALAACGSEAGSASSGGPASSASPAAPAAKVALTITVTPRPGAHTRRWTLRCEPTGGTHPDADAACHQLLTAKDPFQPIPRNIMCPMIVTGEQKATVQGTWFGKPVDVSFSQLNGCASVRWNELGRVFGGPVH
jgi:hypothetical protein